MNKPKVVCLMGPTASGKTGLAVEMAANHDFEIVSVDSALIYKGMDIGTAKPEADVLAKAPHRLIDIIDPIESYSAADFLSDAKREINDILSKGKTPLLVGGTMMYFNALQKGLAAMPSADIEMRAQLDEQVRQYGLISLYDELMRVDPESAKRIGDNDPQRLQRAVEVYRLTGKSMTQWWAEQTAQELPYDLVNIAVMPEDRSTLHKRIEQRFNIMMDEGFLAEVEALYARGDLTINMPSVRCVGYRQLWQYLEGLDTLDDAIYKGVVATRQLAKRQLTWLRGWDELAVFNSLDRDLFAQTLKYVQSRII
ncbi:tRNA (adenosine(37)-N6)-dimethylallyltransferase MiaA [Marinomonas piezotolerans]|uniref:tRNA (adenosine(37)-N6)-dimethylallyltransferase MiaA n=1 Tax=Marinomonas piezotolerans TaxID=2213058 RepID=UPI0013143D08|nr:tRNA (adenosine(37)-N6)-dimethylallyltransferase MiaA [Marinomonas piezotolerans]